MLAGAWPRAPRRLQSNYTAHQIIRKGAPDRTSLQTAIVRWELASGQLRGPARESMVENRGREITLHPSRLIEVQQLDLRIKVAGWDNVGEIDRHPNIT